MTINKHEVTTDVILDLEALEELDEFLCSGANFYRWVDRGEASPALIRARNAVGRAMKTSGNLRAVWLREGRKT
jgi:hypothetical protein